ncbi:MAG: choice-of-anchor J domain-containing protein [Bacteroidales bacterium]|nr:choice-of-anchor J domain-containing protein [Bacteroidales bacterium]
MKKRITLSLFKVLTGILVLGMFLLNVSAQVENNHFELTGYSKENGPSDNFLIIGDTLAGFGTYPDYLLPWGNYYRNQRSQTLYLASEFGQPMLITDLAWKFERISGPDNYLLNVTIKILETYDNFLNSGEFYDMSGATEVFSSDSLVPAASTGWNTIDIDDYTYYNTKNLVIEIAHGDNGYYEFPYYRTYKSEGSYTRMLLGFSNDYTPAPYSHASDHFDNLRIGYQDLPDPGSIEGYTFNGDGLVVTSAYVVIDTLEIQTLSGVDGYYLLDPVQAGNWYLQSWKEGYNLVAYPVTVASNNTTYQEIILTQPAMIISPLQIDHTLPPNGYVEDIINILNNGDGPLDWQADIFPDTTDWLSLDQYAGNVEANGSSFSLPVYFNATGYEDGDFLTADITFTSDPDVGTTVVPVSLTVSGDPIPVPENLQVEIFPGPPAFAQVSWEFNYTVNFYYFRIIRNGIYVGSTTEVDFTDYLPEYGEYCYEVDAVYSFGQAAPAGPVCDTWENPEMIIDPQSLTANVWIDQQETVYTSISNDGIGPLIYEFPEAIGFIASIVPDSGLVSEGGMQQIAITYDASGYTPGTYNQWLVVESNDPDQPTDSIENTMIVGCPGVLSGTVTDGNTGAPIAGVEVAAATFSTLTNENGNYTLLTDPDFFDVYYDKTGYATEVIPTQITCDTVQQHVTMWEFPYNPGWVVATTNFPDETECLIEWTPPWGDYEIIYDDGLADDFLVFSQSGNGHAVKFSPAGYPCSVQGGKVYIGDGNFPAGADLIGSAFGFAVLDDDGANGKPGTILDSIEVTVDHCGWITVENFNVEIEEGDFYIAMFQGALPPNAAPIGIDQTQPTVYRSYTFINTYYGYWSLSSYQDFMIRAIVSGPDNGDHLTNSTETLRPPPPLYKHFIATGLPAGIPGKVKAGEMKPLNDFSNENNRDETGYRIYRYSNFDPNHPISLGDATLLVSNTNDLNYVDPIGGLAPGWYAYCVQASYEQGGDTIFSDCDFSNIVGKEMQADVIVNVSTLNGQPGDTTEVILTAQDYPYEVESGNTWAANSLEFEWIWKGHYNLYASKIGYEPYALDKLMISADTTIEIILSENKYPPTNLYVDSLTSLATWSPARLIALQPEGFEGEQFPPPGWSTFTLKADGAWYRTDHGSSSGFQIPEWDSYYACDNENLSGSTGSGCCDYLITPELDLRESPEFSLKFHQYFDGMYNQLAVTEISQDAGETWEVVQNMEPNAGVWTYEEIDLSVYSGDYEIPSVWIAFHADDQGGWGSGWAVDNVEVSVGSEGDWPPTGYHLFLDDVLITETQDTSYRFLNLNYGQEYTASVGAVYASGISEKDYYTFTSGWLYPPENLAAATYDNAVLLKWDPPCAPWFEIMSVGEREKRPHPNTEYSPAVRKIKNNTNPQRDFWDTQFEFPCGDATGEAGIESDGNYIYTTKWNAGNGTFFRYETDGTFLGSFVIAGCQDVRDLAYDGEYFYGSNASTMVWGMDFDDETVVETINTPVATRAIAYDEDFDAFWANNWSTDITLYDRDGVLLNSFPVGSYSNFYGFAWDDQEIYDASYLYGFSQDASGAVIVQFVSPYGNETGVVYDAIGFSTSGSGVAGGLAISGGISGFEYTMLGIIQNETIFGLSFGHYPPGGECDVPENVLGFNIYRDNEHMDYLEYDGQDKMEWWDYDLLPMCYDYEVSAVYDLSPYGQFGDEGESMRDGPATICLSCCNSMPFMEDWESGSFDTKEWEVHCDNWEVNSMTGNPGHSAAFQWDPVLENYECGLITYPIIGSDVTDGNIYLDFDLMIDDRFDTVKTEKLDVRVWADGNWTGIHEFVAQGDADWESYHMDISEHAKGFDFRVGFFAKGENSINIDAWYIDNVNVYQICPEPRNLSIERIYESEEMGVVALEWEAPFYYGEQWLGHHDGSFENSFASNDGGAGLAQLLIPEEYPAIIKKICYFNDDYGEPGQISHLYILSEDGNEILAGPYSIENAPGADWVNVELADLTIESGGFMINTINVAPDGPYIGADDSYYDGSLFLGSPGEFTELGEFGYYYVGSHEAWVNYPGGDHPDKTYKLRAPGRTDKIMLSDIDVSDHFALPPKRISRDLNAYNIWRNGELIAENWTELYYHDTLYESKEYCYFMNAVYDQCESDTVSFGCISFYTGKEPGPGTFVMIFPNPAKDNIMFSASERINKILIFDKLGQLIYEENLNNVKQARFNIAGIKTGAYLIKLEKEDGMLSRKLLIIR